MTVVAKPSSSLPRDGRGRAAIATFYMSTWETYFTHTLYLGIINGPVEGTLGLCGCFLMTAYYGALASRSTGALTVAMTG